MNKKALFNYLLFSIVFFESLSGQAVYSLKDCIAIGLENNFSILVAKNNEEISSNNFTPGYAGYLPYLNIGGRYSGTSNDIRQNLYDGTSNVTRGATSASVSASATLGMTIFRGFNVKTTYRKLGELKDIGELNTQAAIESYLATLASTYYNYIQQLQLAENLKYAVELSRERLRIDEQRYLLGSGSKLQVLQSRVYFNSDSSKLSKQYETVRSVQVRLNELMAVSDLGMTFTLKDTAITVIPDLLYEKLYQETIESNTSLLIARKNKIISEYDYKISMARRYPYLDATAGYSYALSESSQASYKSQNTSGFNYGLTLSYNLFDGFNVNRQVKNAALDLKNKELKYSEIEQGIKADLIRIYFGYVNNLRLIKLEEQNLETATENLAIAMERYRLGNLSGLDLREVQKSLLDANERLLSVEYQAKIAEISLLQISGNIMNYYK